MDFAGTATPLSPDDIDAEAQQLGVEPATIWAVCDVESSGSGFLPDRRPKILFEAHAFHTLTGGRYDRSNPNISAPFWDRSLYGASGAHQYDRLAEAIALDRTAALESASWGRFQIMGSNYHECNYDDIETFVESMMDDERNHLFAFGYFCQSGGLVNYLVHHDWAHFALHYNGTGNVSDYAGKLAAAYAHHLATNPAPTPTSPQSHTLKEGSTGMAVLDLQNQLLRLGFPISPDGYFGPQTVRAVRSFQRQHKLFVDGVAGPITQEAIQAALDAA